MRWLLALLLALALPAWAQDLRPVPVLTARVIDQTGTLDALQITSLENKLAAFEQQAGPQIVILMLPATAPEDIAAYAQRVGEAWKIGRRDVGDGLLIVVAKDERKVRIEVAKALEGAVPDLAARQIIQSAITPAFKKGDYAGGLNQAVDQLQARIRGEALPAPTKKSNKASGGGDFDIETLAMLFFIGVPIVGVVLTAMLGRKLGSLSTSAGVGTVGWLIGHSWWIAGLAALLSLILIGVMGIGSSRRSIGRRHGGGGSDMPIIWGGGGGSWGGGSGSSDGGGFSSGGGGDFGGGGASGDW